VGTSSRRLLTWAAEGSIQYEGGDMKISILVLTVLLSACGAETATTAATAAAVKKQEIIEGEKMQKDLKQRIDQSASQTQERAEKDSER
jgi:hypothetical protein